MQNWQPSNPVERRLMAAHDDWMKFAQNESARLLYWQTNEADQELVKVYFQGQQDLSCAVFCLDTDFSGGEKYAAALSAEIIDFYEKSRAGSAEKGVEANWNPPKKDARETETQYLLKLTNSLAHHHPDVFPAIILVLRPRLKGTKDFERWLDTLLTASQTPPWQSEQIRFVLFGTDEKPLPWLHQKQPQLVQIITGKYHMEAVARELIAASGERGSSGRFRRLFVELGETLSHKDPARLEKLRRAALDISTQEKWFDQSVAVHLIAGAAYMKWQKHQGALQAYEQAEQAAGQAIKAQHPAGNKLMVNALFGKASVHLAQGDTIKAARCYEQAAPYAEAEKDGLLAVEAWRMASFCLDKGQRRAEALEAGLKALAAGQWIDAPLRANSNLQLVVEWILVQPRLSEHQARQIFERLVALYGPDWVHERLPKAPEEISRQMAAQFEEPEPGEPAS